MVVTVTVASTAKFPWVVDRAMCIVKAEQVSCLGQQNIQSISYLQVRGQGRMDTF